MITNQCFFFYHYVTIYFPRFDVFNLFIFFVVGEKSDFGKFGNFGLYCKYPHILLASEKDLKIRLFTIIYISNS